MFEAFKLARARKRTFKEQDKQARLRLEEELKSYLDERAIARLKHEEVILLRKYCPFGGKHDCVQNCAHYQEGFTSGPQTAWAKVAPKDATLDLSAGDYCMGYAHVEPPFCRLWPEENQPDIIFITERRKYK